MPDPALPTTSVVRPLGGPVGLFGSPVPGDPRVCSAAYKSVINHVGSGTY
ncbi:hypothetical protein ASZ90_008902 [hydrocarbon metagenome]|uniref:Uncharacterized protein n=1 Tax=hydrocarbon metagenome TaxID=938273 RepID=A0A0W8FKR4_9ZZZZ